MSIDFAQVSAAVASTLAPFLPYLVEGGKKFAADAGDAAWKKAQSLWQELRQGSAHDPKIIKSAELVAADPADEAAQVLFAKAMAVRLQDFPQLATELTNLLGGETSVQEVLADRASLVENVEQQVHGTGNARQLVKADQHSAIKGVKQIKD